MNIVLLVIDLASMLYNLLKSCTNLFSFISFGILVKYLVKEEEEEATFLGTSFIKAVL